jgi:hypothetical protein
MPVDWVTEQLRLSVFSDHPVTATEREWQRITGQEEAENRTAIAGGKMFSGSFQGGTLSLAYSGSRVDVILNATLRETTDAPELPSVGPWSDASVSFRDDNVKKWLEQTTVPIVRLAFGAILLHQVDSRESAYKKLDELLISVTADPKMRELLFRCNWPVESKAVHGLMINRITAWAAVRAAQSRLQVTGESFNVSPGPELDAVRLEIDHNTDQANSKPFDKGQLVPIFQELMQLAQQNAEKGEVS